MAITLVVQEVFKVFFCFLEKAISKPLLLSFSLGILHAD